MWQLQAIGVMGLVLFAVYMHYRAKEKRALKKILEDHVHPFPDIAAVMHQATGGANNGGAWRNRTWKPNPGFNDEFAGRVNNTCGQIRPGEWQCNCIDKDAGCRVLIRLKAEGGPAEEITDRRGAIAAQKARKKKS